MKKKHCDKCSYMTEEGLAISGCAYCGCHGDKPMTQPIQKEWEKGKGKLIEIFPVPFMQLKKGKGLVIIDAIQLKEAWKKALYSQAQEICEEIEKNKSPYLYEKDRHSWNQALSQAIEMIKKEWGV